ncbi:hypothetical protein PN498_19265 [Oscillatoria sp. CS-180]|uniref:hypothetical protein n=1 Tax=Oscillatoria sp. CS-180 TaxID=3021720 RepID=UPI00232E704E|nr:hypothetical protein [Oscillatoria sp. CS-180]MDB9528141.1 hypothetical protein [Oscillatoria sp. CS-180]
MLAGIATLLFTVLAGIYTAFILPSLQDYLKTRIARYNSQREESEASRNKINLIYLNPLRLWLEEAYVRLSEIADGIDTHGSAAALLFVTQPSDVSKQEAAWFNSEGCYLVSTCYITACLFFAIKQVRDNIPYLRLAKGSDTELMTLLFQVSQAFLQELGVFYVIQPSIGNDVYLAAHKRLMTYREFCELLQQPEQRVWFDRLILFYLETGAGKKRARIQTALRAIQALSTFLDSHIGKGVAIGDRLKAERG